MTVYQAWASGHKWVITYCQLCRLMMNSGGWFLMDKYGRWQRVSPDCKINYVVPPRDVQVVRNRFKQEKS